MKDNKFVSTDKYFVFYFRIQQKLYIMKYHEIQVTTIARLNPPHFSLLR